MRDTRVAWVLAACMLGVVGACAPSLPSYASSHHSVLDPILEANHSRQTVCSAGEVTLYIQSKVSGDDNFGQPVRIIFSIVPGLVANLVCTVLVGWRTW